MICSTIFRQAVCLAVLLGCSCCLCSCGTIGNILGYILRLPGRLISSII